MFDLDNLSYLHRIQPFEWVMLVLYMLVMGGISFYIQVTRVKTEPLYRHYMKAVLAKIISSVVFCLIYIYYYNGGDTVCYYETARSIANLGMKNPADMLAVLTSAPSPENYSLFDQTTGYPWAFMYYDSQTFFVAKMLVPILFVAFRSYLVASVILSWLSFFGIWKLFMMFCRQFKGMEKLFVFGVLFVPSVLFWGSGILKDTFTFSAVCWFIVGLNSIILKRKRISNIIIVLLASFVMLSIKPYILISLLPGAIVWVLYTRISKLNSKAIRYLSIPAIYVFSFLVGFGILSALGDRLGKFSIEKMLVTASITQKDLKQDYYHGNSFDIGELEPTPAGVLKKLPAAIMVGLFRPYIWEARNVVMLVSGLENLLYLTLTIILLFRMVVDFRLFFRVLLDNPILIFLLSYSFFFSGLVGLSTSNFGALVRFKIPFLPSFICAILILNFFLGSKKSKYLSGNYRLR